MAVVQPWADRCVARLAAAGVEPTAVVLAHGLSGLLAAVLLATPVYAAWLGAALLLLLKTLLDNVDGGLARVTGRVTEAGRYLDTAVDLLVNAALFAALALHGPALAAAAAFVGLTLVLSLDYNLERRYRELRGEVPVAATPLPEGAPSWLLELPRGLYRAVLAPQDRLLQRLDLWLFERAAGRTAGGAPERLRLEWSDLFSTGSVVNLGLSTQLTLLALLCVLQRPYLYVAAVFAQLVYVAMVQAIRVLRLRAALRQGRGSAT